MTGREHQQAIALPALPESRSDRARSGKDPSLC